MPEFIIYALVRPRSGHCDGAIGVLLCGVAWRILATRWPFSSPWSGGGIYHWHRHNVGIIAALADYCYRDGVSSSQRHPAEDAASILATRLCTD